MPISAEERAFARDLLTGSLAAFAETVRELTPDQWNYATEGCWSPVMIAEHLYATEAGLMRRIPQAPPPEVARPERDHRIVTMSRDRSYKIKAPDRLVPDGRTTDRAELLAKLHEGRQKTIAWLDDPAADHRAHAMEHPALKTLDGYQWLLMIAAHMERHTAQIIEIKASPDFPGKASRASESR